MRNLIFIIISAFFLSCNTADSRVLSSFQTKFQDEVFDTYSFQLDTIRKADDPELALHPEGYYAAKFSGYFLVKNAEDENYQKLKRMAQQYETNGTRTISIPLDEGNLEVSEKDKILYVPDFQSPFMKSISDFTKNIDTTIVFRSKEGIFFKEEYKEDLSPTVKNHGYSQGITFNNEKEVIIFWVVVW